MSAFPRLTTLVLAFALALSAPAAARQAAAGGPTGGLQATPGMPSFVVAPGALLNRTVAIRGTTGAGDAGRAVSIERRLLDGSWQPIASTLVDRDGTFRAAWRTDELGRVLLRAVVDRGGSATASSTPLTAQLSVFERAIASWYGPGLFGRPMSCGGRLTRRTVGVAHKTLPCGTRVQLYHRGRVLTVPVVDRGPFVAGRDWDLTQAAARRLGVTATVPVGVLSPEGLPLRAPGVRRR